MMRKENSTASHTEAIDFFSSENGKITTYDNAHRFTDNPCGRTVTSSELIHCSITEALKYNSELRDRAAPFIDVLAARFSEEILIGMPAGFNCIDSPHLAKWLMGQIKALDESAFIRPSIPNHPLKIPPKLESLSQGDSENEVSFHHAGFICYREEHCTPPRFNICQKLWPYRRVSMDWITSSEGYCALAANILYAYACDQKKYNKSSSLEIPTFLTCTAFADYFFETIPMEGGHIPLQEIALWVERNGSI